MVYAIPMTITASLFESFLKCPTQCWLRAAGEAPSGNAYAEWVTGQNESYRATESERFLADSPPGESARSPLVEDCKTAKWRLAVDVAAQTPSQPCRSRREEAHPSVPQPASLNQQPSTNNGQKTSQSLATSAATVQPTAPPLVFIAETHLHAIERVPSESRGKAAQFVPIRFIFRNKLTRDDKLLLAFDAFVLSAALGREIAVGKIIHGDDHGTLKVKTSALATEVRKRMEKSAALLSSPTPPDLILNRHCAECEFQARCRQKAIEKDDLSLLAGMSEKERKELHRKGIFTITQLSYTFRPRRRPKKLRDKRERYHHSLKALAIREKKIHIVGSPELKIEGTPVYLDVEGLPDRDFYYLIGLRIGNGDSAVQHSLWADTVEDEGKIWREFLAILETVEKPVLIHYGSYEKTFLKRMSGRQGSPPQESVAAKAIGAAVNLLSVIFSAIYFPTFSNGLKEIAGWFGFKWSEERPSGVQTICWRHAWETSADLKSRQRLITYNSDDCRALEDLRTLVSRICTGKEPPDVSSKVVAADAVPDFHGMWGRFSSPISAFEAINDAAQWDYQRDRVLLRKNRKPRGAPAKRPTFHRRYVRHNQEIDCGNASTCPRCARPAQFLYQGPRTLYDMRFSASGIRRWVVRYQFRVFYCAHCHSRFGKPKAFWRKTRYGYGVVVLVVYSVVELCMVQKAIHESLNSYFHLGMCLAEVNRLKRSAAEFYEETRKQILARLVAGKLIHADETRIVLKGAAGYVWVFASLREVVFFYAETREGNLLRDSLAGFQGVLVSDFYAAYDAMSCPQQKCLIHLMRDLNDAVLDHPYDEQVKGITTRFGDLLRTIVETIDRRGLKQHYLHKHLVDVERFYRQLSQSSYQSEAALKLKERFERNRGKLFTFLNYDGVPWNNNNAEHAIKAFARLRKAIVGLSTPKGIEEYLILLSVCQTCKYMGVDFLDFLRSGEKDIHAFAESRRGRRGRSRSSKPSGLPPGESAVK